MDHRTRSARNTFSGLILDRKLSGAESMEDMDLVRDWEQALRSGTFVVVRGDDILFDPVDQSPLLLDHRTLTTCANQDPLFLGHDGQTGYFVLDLDQLPDRSKRCLSGLGVLSALRQHAALLPAKTAAILGYARAVSGWHSHSRFCSWCGHPTRPNLGALRRTCTNPDCGQEHFPRVDPAIIVLVHNQDRCLLGRQSRWKPRFYSALAGYVEPGESVEDAVVREVKEEAGIVVEDVRYHSSQPWPFSGSLMLGFHARATSLNINLCDQELEDAKWFTRQEIPALVESGTLVLPAKETIARHLFDAWMNGLDELYDDGPEHVFTP